VTNRPERLVPTKYSPTSYPGNKLKIKLLRVVVPRMLGSTTASILCLCGTSQYCKERKLSNKRFGLKEETLEETLEDILSKY
jgi:hypothetical protein